jgi:alanine racemase
MFATSHIQLSQSALRRNIKFLVSHLGPRVKMSSVVKGNAYGHGIREFVPMAEKCGVRHFSVFSAAEAQTALRSLTQKSEIMIMGDMAEEAMEWAIENRISFWIFEMDRLVHALDCATKMGVAAHVHLELETGLHRTGLEAEDLQAAVELIRKHPRKFVVEGVCTHYAGAESVGNYYRIQKQIQAFSNLCKWLENQGIDYKRRHAACSAATFVYPDSLLDMARIGIAQYGFWPSRETRMHYMMKYGDKAKEIRDPLRRVIKWVSRVMSIKHVPKGEFVGYGNTYLTTRSERVAVVPIGYSDGFSRTLSNLGHVLVRGRRAPVIGVVNMNAMTINVTEIPGVQQGDEVVIIGKQKRNQISVGSFSDLTRYLNYEVLVRLPGETPRIVVK